MTESDNQLKSPETEILIIDDNPQYTMVLKKILLSAFGYERVTSAENLGEGYELIRQSPERFGLLFVDYNLGNGETGGQLLDRLKDEDLLGKMVAFLITSEPTIDNTKSAIRSGAYGVVAKPFDRDDLAKQLEKAARSIFLDSVDSF